MANKLICGAYTNTSPTNSPTTDLWLSQWTSLKGAVTTPSNLLVRRVFASGVPSSINGYMKDGSTFPANGVAFPSCKPSYTNITANNTAIRSLAASLPDGSYFTAWHEPENDMTGAQYVAMFRNFYTQAKSANPNIYVGNVYMSYQWRSGGKVPVPDDWWVGSNFTDFLMVDTYMDTWQTHGGDPLPMPSDPQHMRWHNWAVTKGKPLGVTESGVALGFTDSQRAAYYNACETWMVAQGYRMWLPWNGVGTPPNGQSWDFYGGPSSWPLTFAAFNGIVTRGQTNASLTPTTTSITDGFVDATSAAGNPASSQAITLPSGMQGGDGIYLWIPYAAVVGTTATTMTPPAGWTSLGAQSSTTSSNGITGRLYYKTAAGSTGAASPDSNTTVSFTVSQQCKVAPMAAAFRGVTASPTSVTFGADAQVASTTHGPTPSVSPASPSYVLTFLSGKNGATPNTSYSTPSGATKREEIYGTGTGAIDGVLFGSGSPVSSGGGLTTTTAQASTWEVYATVVLTPLGAVTPPPPPTYSPPVVTDVQSTPDAVDPTIVTLSITASDPANGALTYHVDWGDHTAVQTSTSSSVTHDYASGGFYTASITATSSVSSLTGSAFTTSVVSAVNSGLSTYRNYPMPQPGMAVTALSKLLREQIIPDIDIDMNTALGNSSSGAIARTQSALLRNWLGLTCDPSNASGSLTLAGGNVYWWQVLVSSPGNMSAVDFEVVTALSGTGTVLSLRSATGDLLASASADTALGTTGLRRLTIATTPITQGGSYIVSVYIPSGVTTAPVLRAATASATTVALGSSSDNRIAVVTTAASNPTTLDTSTGSATGIALLGVR